ncbi:hypothetical protein RQP46_000084 [Phenoliferia psychrophenolica]
MGRRQRTAHREKSPSSDPADLTNKTPPSHTSNLPVPSSRSRSKRTKVQPLQPPNPPQSSSASQSLSIAAPRRRGRLAALIAQPPTAIGKLPTETLTHIMTLAAKCPNPEPDVESGETAEDAFTRAYKYQQATYLAMALVCRAWEPITKRGLLETLIFSGKAVSVAASVLNQFLAFPRHHPTNKIIVNWHHWLSKDFDILEQLSSVYPPEELELRLRKLHTVRLTVLIIDLGIGDVSDLAPGSNVDCALKRCCLNYHDWQKFPELTRALFAHNTIEDLEIGFPRKLHSDGAVWRQYLPALTSLKSIVFNAEVPASIPSILAHLPRLASVGFIRCPSIEVVNELLCAPHQREQVATLRLMATPYPWSHTEGLELVEEEEIPDCL